MNKKLTKVFTGCAALLLVLALADASYAQPRRARGKTYSKQQIENIIERVEERVDNFAGRIDKSLDNSRLDGTNREDTINNRAKDLEKATDELRREFDHGDRWVENKDEVRNCLNIANDINVVMKRRKFSRETDNNWERERYELNTLAKVFDLPPVGSSIYR